MQQFVSYTRILKTGAPAPGATVGVYVTGTEVLALLYSDNLGTPMGNPFTSDDNGLISFLAPNGRYDIRVSGLGIDLPYAWPDILFNDISEFATILGTTLAPVRIRTSGGTPDDPVNGDWWMEAVGDSPDCVVSLKFKWDDEIHTVSSIVF